MPWRWARLSHRLPESTLHTNHTPCALIPSDTAINEDPIIDFSEKVVSLLTPGATRAPGTAVFLWRGLPQRAYNTIPRPLDDHAGRQLPRTVKTAQEVNGRGYVVGTHADVLCWWWNAQRRHHARECVVWSDVQGDICRHHTWSQVPGTAWAPET